MSLVFWAFTQCYFISHRASWCIPYMCCVCWRKRNMDPLCKVSWTLRICHNHLCASSSVVRLCFVEFPQRPIFYLLVTFSLKCLLVCFQGQYDIWSILWYASSQKEKGHSSSTQLIVWLYNLTLVSAVRNWCDHVQSRIPVPSLGTAYMFTHKTKENF